MNDQNDLLVRRKELERLLDSCIDEKRIRFVKKALDALDREEKEEYDSNNTDSISPAIQTLSIVDSPLTSIHNKNLNGSNTLNTIVNNSSSTGGILSNVRTKAIRPQSARVRRPSTGSALDVIPENRTLKQRVYDRNVEIELEGHDVNEITATSLDPKYPPNPKLFENSMKSSPWISTGMLPQVFTVNFHSHWTFRKIQLWTSGIESMHFSTKAAGSSISSKNRIKDEALESLNNSFVYDTKLLSEDKRDQVWGNQLMFTINKASEDFVAILGIQVIAIPMVSGPVNKEDTLGTGSPRFLKVIDSGENHSRK